MTDDEDEQDPRDERNPRCEGCGKRYPECRYDQQKTTARCDVKTCGFEIWYPDTNG